MKRLKNNTHSESTQSGTIEQIVKMAGDTKYSFLRPMKPDIQPLIKPPKNIPINADAAIIPCQKFDKSKAFDISNIVTPMMLRT